MNNIFCINKFFLKKINKPKNFKSLYDLTKSKNQYFDIIEENSISKELYNIIRDYTMNGYKLMNSIERDLIECIDDNKAYKQLIFKNLKFKKEIQRKNDLLCDELNKHEIKKDIYVYKLITDDRLRMLLKIPNKFKNLCHLKNRILVDKGFVSTSLLKIIEYSDLYKPIYILKIKVPKGTSGAFIGRLSKYESETEILLNRNQCMLITDFHEENFSLSPSIIECTIIPQKKY